MKAGQPGRFSCLMRGCRLRPGARRAMTGAGYAGLITAAHRYLDAPVIVIRDNLPTHLSRKMRALGSRGQSAVVAPPSAGRRLTWEACYGEQPESSGTAHTPAHLRGSVDQAIGLVSRAYPDVLACMRAGVRNGGEAAPPLKWWRVRLMRECWL